MIEKIIIQQTRQIQQYEPLKIEVHIMPDENWRKNAREAIDNIQQLLYPKPVFISDEDLEDDDDYEPSYEKREEPSDEELEELEKDDINF